MDDQTINLDPTDEDILTYQVSDEALERAASNGGDTNISAYQTYVMPTCYCCTNVESEAY